MADICVFSKMSAIRHIKFMWARVVEIMFGFWLIVSRFVFRHDAAEGSFLTNDLLCGFAVMILGFASFWQKTWWAHFLILLVALWLIIYGYSMGYPSPPTAQNQIVTGLLLAVFAIIPNDIDEVPDAWKKFYADKNS